MREEVLKYVHPSLRNWVLKNVTIDVTTDVPTMGVGLVPDFGIKLFINPDFYSELNDEQKRTAWVHELTHIARGDIFMDIPKEDREYWNIAMDAVINDHFPEKIQNVVEEMDGILYKNLYEELDLPKYVCFTNEQIIVERLKEKTQKKQMALKEMLKEMGMKMFDEVMSPPGDLSPKDKMKAYIETMALQGLIEKDAELREMIGKFTAGAEKAPIKSRTYEVTRPIAVPLVDKIMAICKKAGNKFRKLRSYRREGLVEGLRGLTRRRIGSVFLGMDVSGSVYSYIPFFLGVGSYLTFKKYIVKFGTFSDNFTLYNYLPKGTTEIQNAGGGTEIKEMMDYLNKNKDEYDLAIIITDGEIFDWHKNMSQELPFPILWLLTYNNESFAKSVPKKDIILDVSNLMEDKNG